MPYTKTDLQGIVAENMANLALDAGYTYLDFETPVTFALITVVGSDDATLVTDTNLISVISWAEYYAFKKLYNFYITAVDFKLGPREEKLSQIARGLQNITQTLGIGTTSPIVFRDMTWTFNDFTAGSGIANWPINWFEVDWDN